MSVSLASALRQAMGPRIVIPNDAFCGICGYADVTRRDVLEVLSSMDPEGKRNLVVRVACRCPQRIAAEKAERERRWSEANLPQVPHGRPPRTLESFRPRPGTEAMAAAAERFLRRDGPRVLTLVGGYGCGKSHILEALGRQWLSNGWSVRYEVAATLLERLRHTYSPTAEDDLFTILEWYQRRSLLLLDDLGMERATDYAAEQLTSVVNDRLLHGGYLVIATNKPKDEMAEHLGHRLGRGSTGPMRCWERWGW